MRTFGKGGQSGGQVVNEDNHGDSGEEGQSGRQVVNEENHGDMWGRRIIRTECGQ